MHLGSNGQLKEEIATWKKAIAAAARARDDNGLATAWTRLLLAECETEPEAALSLQLAADAAVLRDHDNPHERVTLLSGVGGAYAALGRFAEAKKAYADALALLNQATQRDEQGLGMVLMELANMEDILGDVESARTHYESAIGIYTRLFGAGHPDLAIASYNFGDFLLMRGRDAEAWSRIDDARRIWEDVYGPDHEHVASALLDLAGLKQQAGEYDQAVAWYKRAAAIRAKVYGADHPQMAPIYGYIGAVLTNQKRYAEAWPYLERAVRIQESQPKQGSVASLAQSRELLGQWYLEQGQAKRARPQLLQAQALYLESLGKDAEPAAERELDLARCDLLEGKPAEAVARASRAVETLERSKSANPFEVAHARFVLGQSLWATPSERPRARVLIDEVHETLRAAGHWRDGERADVEAWLRAHDDTNRDQSPPR
jgi:tetratricopeptide (TPR) repeat protein